jgi:hypothetical protein
MVTESEFQEAVSLIKAANLIRVKNVVERMFQDIQELKQKLEEKENAKPSTNAKPTK